MNRLIAVIPAQKGSIRLKDKNKKVLCGKPLIKYTLDIFKTYNPFDKKILVTDDEDIIKIAEDYDVDVHNVSRRKYEINSVIEYIKKKLDKDDVIILLQPTSPLRTITTIDRCIDALMYFGYDSVTTVSKCNATNTYVPNGLVYVFRNFNIWNNNIGLIVTPVEESIDIDTLFDFNVCEMILNDKNSIYPDGT